MPDTKFKRSVSPIDGAALSGVYESDICRVERNPNGLWVAEVPMRPIGRSAFYEFRPIALGGKWTRIGSFRTRDGAMTLAEKLRDGELVYDSAVTRNGHEPVRIVRFAAVVDEIRNFQ